MTSISLFRYFSKVKYFNQWLIYLIDLMFSCSSTLLSLGLVSFVLAQNYTLYIYMVQLCLRPYYVVRSVLFALKAIKE